MKMRYKVAETTNIWSRYGVKWWIYDSVKEVNVGSGVSRRNAYMITKALNAVERQKVPCPVCEGTGGTQEYCFLCAGSGKKY